MAGELEPLARNELRASHEDRDLIVERLRVAAGDGRIDADELDQRIEAALSARTYGDLDVLVRDLPESPEAAARSVARRQEAAVSQAINVSHGKTVKQGAWLVPQRLVIAARHGVVELDFTEAVFQGVREVELDVDLRHSAVRLILPDGSVLDESSVERGHSAISIRGMGSALPDSVYVRLTGRMAHSAIRVRRISQRRMRRMERRRAIGR